MKRADSERPASSQRGYGGDWPKVRAQVLREAGIPEDQWPLYDVDHVPRWPSLGEDHSLYRLIPRKHGQHSGKTIRETQHGVKAAWRHTLPRPGELFPETVYIQWPWPRFEDWGDA
jgi:hypothetical protein